MVIVVAEILDVVQRLRPKKNISEAGFGPVFKWNMETEGQLEKIFETSSF
jgi:hypothetical protein